MSRATMRRIHAANFSTLRIHEHCDGVAQERLSRHDLHVLRLQSSLSANQSFDRFTVAFGDSSVSFATVKNWFTEFRRERTSLDVEERCGRPSEAVTY